MEIHAVNGFNEDIMKEVVGCTTNVKYTWEKLMQEINKPFFDLKRSVQGHYKYAMDTHRRKEKWASMDSYCKHAFFHFPYKTKQVENEEGDKRTVKYVDDKDVRPSMTLCRNNYPYYLDDDMTHYCLWSTTHLSATQCADVVEMQFPKVSHDILIFETPEKFKSIPDIHHVQVVIRPRKTGMFFVNENGYEKQIIMSS